MNQEQAERIAAMNQERAERIAAAMSEDRNIMRAYSTKTPEQVAEDAREDKAAMKATGKLGDLVAFGFLSMVSGAGLTVIGLMLFAAVRGIGRWLEVW